MNTASPVPSRPPMALVTGRLRAIRSIAISTWSPTATAAAVSRPASALTVTNATGPTPVSTIARRSRSISNGLGGSRAGAPFGSGLGLGGRKHQVVEQLRRGGGPQPAPGGAAGEQKDPGGGGGPRGGGVVW